MTASIEGDPMSDVTITPAQRHAAIEALGLDPDLTVTITLGPEWASIMVADVDEDGKPRMVNGTLALNTLSIPVADQDQP